ncbi:dynactin arp1 p25 subunit [Niveomyces insectorum RCEF 264]|uniref:Dynactin arp1 p25 subunit n=1 Tax=Niveomyces insectorum RCEF 264 TaxID=1081102 RepID=A0A162MRP1_9HYPO|nr:dynactin arp1 p25 subunit [Niveomyces insectorum RCEF 264]
MVSSKILLSAVVAASGASAGLHMPAGLFIRQDDLSPGSPLYNCHDNCGQAILEAQSESSVCKDNVFTTDYDNCLQCAGPDNADIWRYYGSSLTSAAAECGLATTPLAGSQAAVGTAIPAGGAGGGSSSAPASSAAQTTPASSAPAPSSSAPAGVSSTPAPGGSSSPGGTAPSSSAVAGGSSSAAASSSAVADSSASAGSSSAAPSSAAPGSSSAAGSSSPAGSSPTTTAGGHVGGSGNSTSTATGSKTPKPSSSSASSAPSGVVTSGSGVHTAVFGVVLAAAFGAAFAIAF